MIYVVTEGLVLMGVTLMLLQLNSVAIVQRSSKDNTAKQPVSKSLLIIVILYYLKS